MVGTMRNLFPDLANVNNENVPFTCNFMTTTSGRK